MATTTRVVRSPVVKVAGSALPESTMDSLLRLEVHLALDAPSSARLELIDPHFALLDGGGFEVGAAVDVSLPGEDGAYASVFTGKVTAVGIEQDMSEELSVPHLVVEARDARHALATSATYTAYLQGAKDVISAIASRHGLTADIEGTPPLTDYVVQAGTDHAVLDELARRCDHEWFVRGTKLHFRKPPEPASGVTLKRRDDSLLRFSARYTGVDVPASVTVYGSGFDGGKRHQGAGTGVLSATSGALGSDAPLVTGQFGKAKSTFGKDLSVGDVATRDASEAQKLAEGLARELIGTGLHAEGLAPSTPSLLPGDYVTIAEMGTSLSGSYYLTEVTHEFASERDTRTRFVCGRERRAPAPWAPGLGPDTWAGRGPVVGVVTNVNDPDAHGRVKVKFPSLNDTESEWARVVAMGAGAERGVDFRPEVNDEVLVAFERGDPRFPLVLGGLWSPDHKHPVAGIGGQNKVEQRVIASRLGHKLTFGDGSGDADKHVTIELANGTKLELSQASGALLDVVKGDVVLKTKQGTITMTEQGDLTIDVKGAVTVKSVKATKFDAKDAFAVKALTGVTLDGTAKFEAKGAQGKVEGQGMLELKGGMVKIN